jgi:hypothetical protein
MARERRGFVLETFRSVASNRDSEAVAAIAALCDGFPTEEIWIAGLSIDSGLFRTARGGAGEAVAALARTEITSFGKLLLLKFSGGNEATGGGLGEVADGVRIQA